MPRGGPRPNSGRKPGSRNKKTEQQIQAVEQSGLTPLDYLLSVMRDEANEAKDRVEAAKAAAPYVHPRLSQMQLDANVSLDHESALDELDDEPEGKGDT